MRLKLSNSFTIAISASLLALSLWAISPIAESQVGVLKENVALQGANPGFSQSGNANISGTLRAGQFVGGGAGLANVTATSIALPYSATMNFGGSIFQLTNQNNVNFSAAIRGTAISGNTIGVYGLYQGATNGYGIYGKSESPTGGTGVYGVAEGTGSRGVQGVNQHPTGIVYGVSGQAESPSGYAVFGLNTSETGNAVGVYGSSFSIDGRGLYGLGSGDNGIGVFGLSGGPNGTSIYGDNNSATGTTIGVRAQVSSVEGTGVFSEALATSGASYGVRARNSSSQGIAVLGETLSTTGSAYGGVFRSASSSGVGVFGDVSSTTGLTYGVQGQTASTSGSGVFGNATATTGGTTGVFGTTASITGRGVFGEATALSGTSYGGRFHNASISGRGVFGLASDTTATSTIYGVLGSASTATLGYGVYALGDSGASGIKSFRIDHPGDPLNKYLMHYASESPFPQNFYNGNVTTDAKGYAWVELPEYFSLINANFKYQLTVVDDGDSDDFVLAKVSKEIKGNRFQVRTSVPHVKVSWMIFADRDDERIRHNRPVDVREKSGLERGKYQHPEYFGAPAGMGIEHHEPIVISRPR